MIRVNPSISQAEIDLALEQDPAANGANTSPCGAPTRRASFPAMSSRPAC